MSICRLVRGSYFDILRNPADAPLKRFAARFTYNGIDEIASRDLGFGTGPIAQPPPLPRLESQSASIKRSHPESPRQSPRIPEARYRNGRDDRAGPMAGGRMEEPRAKRAKPSSPPRREAVRNNRRDLSPPMRAERPPMPIAPVGPEMDRSGLPKAVVWFLGNLPRPDLFDGKILRIHPDRLAHIAFLGPRFQADDIMNVLSTVQMPTNTPAYGPRSNSGEWGAKVVRESILTTRSTGRGPGNRRRR